METTARDNISSASGILQEPTGPLNRASSDAHAAVDSIAESADEAARQVKPAIDRIAAVAHRAVDTAASAAAPTAEWVTAQGASLRATQKRLVADTCNYVTTNPLKSVGIAVAAGIVLGGIIALVRNGQRGVAPPSP